MLYSALHMNDSDWVIHPVTDFQIYRMNGKGSVKVGVLLKEKSTGGHQDPVKCQYNEHRQWFDTQQATYGSYHWNFLCNWAHVYPIFLASPFLVHSFTIYITAFLLFSQLYHS